MKSIRIIALSLTTALGLVLLVPAAGHSSTPVVNPPSACSSPASNFSVQIGYDSATQKPTVDKSSNTSCVWGGNTVSFTVVSPTVTTWDAIFPTPTGGQSAFANGCTFGNGTNQSSSCTVVTGPTSGDYVYEVDVWVGGNKYTLDPKVIIKSTGLGGKKHHHHAASPATPPQ